MVSLKQNWHFSWTFFRNFYTITSQHRRIISAVHRTHVTRPHAFCSWIHHVRTCTTFTQLAWAAALQPGWPWLEYYEGGWENLLHRGGPASSSLLFFVFFLFPAMFGRCVVYWPNSDEWRLGTRRKWLTPIMQVIIAWRLPSYSQHKAEIWYVYPKIVV
jgi:hypothetical protein